MPTRILGVDFTTNPLRLRAAALAVVLGSAFFATLSLTIAGITSGCCCSRSCSA